MPDLSRPLVSIGMPVCNGGKLLHRAIGTLISQSYANLQIVISDNASTDETEPICRSYASRDARICYRRNQSNLGAARNFENALHLAAGEYFMWAAHDDCWHSDFVQANLEQLLRNPLAIASISKMRLLQGDMIVPTPSWANLGTSPLLQSLEQNLAKYVANPGMNSRFYALFRRNVLVACLPFEDYCASDWTLVAKTLGFGGYAEVNRVLFFRGYGGASCGILETLAKGQRSVWERWFPAWRFTKHVLQMEHAGWNLALFLALLRTNAHFAAVRIQALVRKAFMGTDHIAVKTS